MKIMSSDPFQILDIQTAGGSLEHLHAHVVRCSGRIEIHCPSGKVCVLISKTELESLEQMLEPERKGGHKKDRTSKPPWLLIALHLVLLAAGAAAAVVFAMR